MSYLKLYVDKLNWLRGMTKAYKLRINSPIDRKDIHLYLDADLSPENLCCDGELRGAALRAKSQLLYGALAELNARDKI